ncbi:MAG TPA: endolytic transglycosylase MltG, partial [Candidatus Moranbacteria bacterium]|nr:endolytic transglycosylase MltG [Candidatus Moranbacteria bacterium]
KILGSSWKFVWTVYKTGNQKKIKAGKYLLNNKLSVGDIVHIITIGDKSESEQIKITFPEGWTISQMAKRLNANGFAGDEFISLSKKPKYFADKYGYDFLRDIPEGKDLQGFLFPDTYFFAKNSSAEDIIKKMLSNFKKKVNDDLRNEIEKQRKNLYEVITMASILEREVKSPEDKKIVSGIFWQRIKNGQALQSCATLAYVLGENKKQYSYQDTRIQSPYNTYLHKGLPPGPISNPGMEAIIAAIYPTKTSYNYFLNNPKTGKTVFSKTLEEHNLNKIKNGL